MESQIVNNYREQLLNILKMNPEFVSSKGDWLYDKDGNRVYDALSQYGVQIFGHNNEEINGKAEYYLKGHNTNFIQPFYSSSTKKLSAKLITSLNNVFNHVCYTNSGAESVEAAIKLARLKTGKKKVISLKNGFHGKTYSALSACGSDRYKTPEISDGESFISIAIGDIEGFKSAIKDNDVASFIFEPIQGEGGMQEVPGGFLTDVIDLCKSKNIIVIADEIQCGLNRCGALSYALRKGYAIDVLLLGKGLGGGVVPIGAVIYTKKMYTSLFEKKHSSTFAGGGFACSVALNVIDVLTRNKLILSAVDNLSQCVDRNIEKISAKYSDKVEITGVGLMRAINFDETHGNSNYFTMFLHNNGMMSYIVCSYLLHRYAILTMPLMSNPCAIRFEPALTTSEVQVDRFFEAIDDIANLFKLGRYDILLAHLIGAEIKENAQNLEHIPPENTDHPLLEALSPKDEEYKDFDFAFLVHITSEPDVLKILPKAMQLKYTLDQQLAMAEMFITAGKIDPSPDVSLAFKVRNRDVVQKGLLIFSPLTARSLMRLSAKEKMDLIDEYFARAMELGAKIVGLGAYTSVITRAGLDIANRYKGVHITTGNSLTAISTYEQFCSVYRPREGVVTTIIGARGSVGRVVTSSIINDVPKVILVGKKNTSIQSYQEFLVELVNEANIYQGPIAINSVTSAIKSAFEVVLGRNPQATTQDILAILCSEDIESDSPIILSSAVKECLNKSHYVISCTSEGKPFLDDSHLPDDAVALDAGRPFDFLRSQSGKARVYEAGLVKQPHSSAYGDCNCLIATPGVNLACFSETIILSLEGVNRNYSMGKAITLQDVSEVRLMAEKYNYVPCLVEEAS